MMLSTGEVSDELAAACFDVARTTKWEQRPIDADEINSVAAVLTKIAKNRVL